MVANCLILMGSLCMVICVFAILTGLGYIAPDFAISIPSRVASGVLITAAYNLFWAIKYGVI